MVALARSTYATGKSLHARRPLVHGTEERSVDGLCINTMIELRSCEIFSYINFIRYAVLQLLENLFEH